MGGVKFCVNVTMTAQRDTEEGPDMNPVPKGAGICHECQQISEEIVDEIDLTAARKMGRNGRTLREERG